MVGDGVKIGLEVHCQLTSLKTKLFCSCPTDYRGKPPNTNVCPVCMGEPGTLPVLNKEAVRAAVMVALALHSKISRFTYFTRKNYFYPDMAKNFQISQYDGVGGAPIAKGGYVDLGNGKVVRIRRLQLEEDPARLVYEGTIDTATATLVDYNRHGVALIEIVTEPDITSPEDARRFLQKLRSILEHLGVFDGELEGSMRCDANISLEGGVRVEIKNISSYKDVERALRFEITRQSSLISRGIRVARETRFWDERRRVTVSLRVKETEEDYRYFPEPDLPPVMITDEFIDEVKRSLPTLPDERKRIFVEKYGVSEQNAEVLVNDKALADFFEECLKHYGKAQELSNLLVGDFLAQLHSLNLSVREVKVRPEYVAKLLKLLDKKVLTGHLAKTVLREMLKTGRDPEAIVEEKGLRRISSREMLEEIVDRVFRENQKAVEDALVNEKAVHFLVGQVMRITRGKADPNLTRQIIKSKLEKVRASREA
ncbi:Asp-tRNA(Asn)/Glu-tRNA(Gln) amidotransferase GatCAB subunit B [Candidatus Bathyarchaeota archaeon]|nr:MAG: Asp-tRNA(Asn)/Glu-tRNA(Gln) amidotransferase GatCAB subunit B [Candidatus Bathyarchaeota archaeon]